MSSGLTPPSFYAAAPPPAPARPTSWRVVAAQVLATIAVFAGVGALCGLLWFHQWDVPSGTVSGGQWFTDEHGLRDDFSGTGWYIVITVAAGLVLGLLAAWVCEHSELATLGAVVVGSCLAGWLTYRVGLHLSAPDPQVLAATAADGTRLDGALRVHGLAPYGAFPFGALLGLMAVYLLTGRRSDRPEAV